MDFIGGMFVGAFFTLLGLAVFALCWFKWFDKGS